MVPDLAADLAADLALARSLADLAAEVALPYVGAPLRWGHKADGSPVSEADLAVERAVVARLAAERPDDSVLSEDGGGQDRAGGRRWLVDPIDGTAAFLSGGTAWGTHVALEVDGDIVVGVLSEGGYPWDHAPGVVLLREAGGRFTDPLGGGRIDLHGGLYSNGHLHDLLAATAGRAGDGPAPVL